MMKTSTGISSYSVSFLMQLDKQVSRIVDYNRTVHMSRFISDQARKAKRNMSRSKQQSRSDTLREQLNRSRATKRDKLSSVELILNDVNDIFNKMTDENVSSSAARLDKLMISDMLIGRTVEVIFAKFMDCSMLTRAFISCLKTTKHSKLLTNLIERADLELVTPTNAVTGKIEISSNEVRLDRWKKSVRTLFVHLYNDRCISRDRLIEVWYITLNAMIADKSNCTYLFNFCDAVHKIRLDLSLDEYNMLIKPMYITDTRVMFRYRHQLRIMANKFAMPNA